MSINKISVIITTYKQAPLLEVILESLMNQDTNHDFEILICDDGSEDGTYAVAQKYASNTRGVKVTYLWQQDRRFRASEARNMGIRQATGQLAILLDGDMIPTREFIKKHIEFHSKHNKTILTGGRRLIDDSIFFRFNCSAKNLNNLMEHIINEAVINHEEDAFRTLWSKGKHPWMAVFSCNLSFPISQLSLYSEMLTGWGIEDWDFGKRLYSEGYAVHYDKDLLAYHVDYKPVISNAFRNNDSVQLAEFARNLLIFFDQHPKEDLLDCAIALKSYNIQKDKLSWAGDYVELRDAKTSVDLLRQWLKRKQIYDSEQGFYIEQHFRDSKTIETSNLRLIDNSLDKLEVGDILLIHTEFILPADFNTLVRRANKLSPAIKIIATIR